MLIGHKPQWELLKVLTQSNRIPQAFIFSGRESLGKKRVALEFIKSLNCEAKSQQKPCGKCFSCLAIEKLNHPDLILVEPQEGEIQIAQIRQLKQDLSFKPQLASFKAVIIDEAQTLNTEAQHCFLKTLEEPQGKALFLLITAYPEVLFRTIRSRCEVLKFYPLRAEEMAEYFKEKCSPSQLKKLILLADGLPGRALKFLEEPQEIDSYLKVFKEIQKLLKADIAGRFSFVKAFLEEEKENQKIRLNSFLEKFISYLRILLLKQLGIKGKVFDIFGANTPKGYSLLRLQDLIIHAEDLRILLLTTNINQRLIFENLMLKICPVGEF